ncbi:MAG TPA: mechanosensitive ion channel family protein [Nostocaceae cyanobacterium]|nr:mechanosensitive ion channel family protein [Nostocaceae cyanobacterium]
MIYNLAVKAAEFSSAFFLAQTPLPAINVGKISGFLSTLCLYAVVALLIYFLVFYILRSLLRYWEKDTYLLIIAISQKPIIAVFSLLSVKFSLYKLGGQEVIGGVERVVTALLIAATTYWLSTLFSEVVVYFLKEYARKTEAVWDDVLIPLSQRFIPILTYLIGIALFFATLGVDLTGIGLTLGSITVVFGLAIKDILSDFFSGLVLLVDTPFKFGDVISMPDGSVAVIRQIGIRVTKLYLINEHCEVYKPNRALANQEIINLTRPTTHYAYTIKIAVRVDADPVVATNILQEIVLGHPDTLGNLEKKIEYLEKFAGLKEAQGSFLSKKEAARQRLLAEKNLNKALESVENSLADLIVEIKQTEKGGLNSDELVSIKKNYLDILKKIGLVVMTERTGRKARTYLEEDQDYSKENLISLVRLWYNTWLKDPDLVIEDQKILPDEWEQKIILLKVKLNKLFQKIVNPGADETRLDDYAVKLLDWLNDSFKESNILWKEPQIQLTDLGGSMQFSVRFYIDNLQLEHWRRGNRVENEVRREMVRRLRQAYIYTP